MSKIGLIFLFVLMAIGGYGQQDHIGLQELTAGQQDHFVLIRADNDQPFYVRLGQQTLNSTPQGHLIIAQLKDSVYSITVGFPKKGNPEGDYPDEDFRLVIDKNDLGFQLKNQPGKGWILVNIQTQELDMPTRMDTIANSARLEGVKKDDAFSRLMAAVVSDTAVMYNSYEAIAAKDSSARKDSSVAHKDSLFARKDSFARKDTISSRDSFFAHKDNPIARMDSPTAGKDSSMASQYNSTASQGSPSPRGDSPMAKRADSPPSSTTSPNSLTSQPDSLARRPADSPARKSDSLTRRPDSLARKSDSPRIKSVTLNDVERSSFAPPPPAPAKAPALPPSTQAAKPVHIKKISEQRTPTTLRLSYTDHAKGHKTDTIDIQIPLDTQVSQRVTVPRVTVPTDTPRLRSAPDITKSSPPAQSVKQVRNKPVLINSDCRDFASDDDVEKLKAKLQAIPDDEARTAAAKKVFKLKCFTTNQLKGISDIFRSEEAKYKFLETAYPFVSDDGFRELVTLFTDPLYIAKFKTMTGAGGQ